MTDATTWHGRRGTVLLGPTEARVARWLAGMTRNGRITIRTVDVAAATHVERSEAYRILARLRVLGLFGIENDRGGTRGGRRVWRTSIETEAGVLNAARHREAWSRIVAWARTRRARIQARLAFIRAGSPPKGRPVEPAAESAPAAGSPDEGPASVSLHGRLAGPSFLEGLVGGGLTPSLVDRFAKARR